MTASALAQRARADWPGIHRWLVREFELGAARNRLLGMEGLRGAAVLLVYFVHSTAAFRPWMPAGGQRTVAEFLEITGHSGVDLFFVLSGFLIWPQAMKPTFRFGSFIRRRVQRIYPAFVVVFAVTLGLMLLKPDESTLWSPAPAAVVYVIANLLLLPGMTSIVPLVTVAWTLSYEFFFYLAAPLLVLCGGLRDRTRRFRAQLLVGLMVLLFVGRIFFATRVQLTEFLFGALLAEYRGTRPTPNVRDPLPWAERVTWGLLIATSIMVFALTRAQGETAATVIPRVLFLGIGCTALTWAALGRVTATAAVMSVAPLRWLGNMSYSYYLTHFLTLKVLAEVVGRVLPHSALLYWPLQVVGFAVTLLPSAALFHVVERRYSLSVPATRPAGCPRR